MFGASRRVLNGVCGKVVRAHAVNRRRVNLSWRHSSADVVSSRDVDPLSTSEGTPVVEPQRCDERIW